jgi:hypothetical protein
VAAVFFSHPDESNIVEKIIATNVERSVVFMGVMKKREATGCLGGRFTDVNVSTLLINVSPTRRSFLANNLVRNSLQYRPSVINRPRIPGAP